MKRYIACNKVDPADDNRVIKHQDFSELEKAQAHVTLYNGVGVYDNSGANMVTDTKDIRLIDNILTKDPKPEPAPPTADERVNAAITDGDRDKMMLGALTDIENRLRALEGNATTVTTAQVKSGLKKYLS